MTEKIKAAVEGRQDRDFLIVARTDARAVEGFDQAVQRAAAYIDAGADAIFPEALQTAEGISNVCSNREGAVAGKHDGISGRAHCSV
jgi:2-methylisocitrate lyase-like PEP mutase family enzyme